MQTLKERASQLKTDVPAVFLALRDPDTPFLARFLAGVTVGYALSPIDLIPDFIPVLGYLDDLLLLPALVALTVRCIPAPVWQRSRARAAGLWAGGKPKKWYYGIPVAALWLLAAGWIAKAVWF
jgi:uncharacterized membrane protein YkvA (DUF1232 family)